MTEAALAEVLARADGERQAGRWPAAEQAYRQAVQLDPRSADAWAGLAGACQQTGKIDDAIHGYRTALELRPRQPRLLNSLGILHAQRGQFAAAEQMFREVVAVEPAHAKALHNLGNVLSEQSKHTDAADFYRRAEQAGYREASLYDGWGGALAGQGDQRAAEAMLQKALHTWPNDPGLLKRLGIVLSNQLCWDGAAACLRQSVKRKPADPEAQKQLGQVYVRLGRLDRAEQHLREALKMRPTDAAAGNDLAVSLLQQGRLDDAANAFRQVIALQPDNAAAYSLRLYLLNYDHRVSPAELLDEHRRWAAKFAPELPADPKSLPNDRDPNRRIRVGYVSPDFRRHPVGRFIEPILASHDPRQVEVICYDEAIRMPDDVTARIRAKVPNWRLTRGLSHNRFADQVLADQIDILVDLAGHTADNRLAAFARRLAPIQITYLGYPNTTGVPAMDYVLTDAVADPPDQPSWFTEQPVRLGGGFCCFGPRDDAPQVSPLPASRTGFVTFGAPHTLGKMNAAVLDLWADLVKAIPETRLLIARNTLVGGTRDYLRKQFADRGVGEDRVELRPLTSGEGEYLGFYREVDITLDTFPWTGHTTACESLWMGVPMLTLRGRTHAGRMVASVMTHAGLPDWIAESPRQYIDIAAKWVKDRDGLTKLRSGLRDRMRRSRLCDAPGFTRQLESSYRDLWRRFCASNPVAPRPAPAAVAPSTNGAPSGQLVTSPEGAVAQAEKFFQDGRFVIAEQVARQVTAAAPNLADGWRILGDACKAQSKPADAIAAYQRAVGLKPDLGPAHASLGILLAGQRNFAAAAHHFSQATAAQPDNPKPFNNLGHALTELGRFPEAVQAYRQAERLGYREAGLYASMGMALVRQRKHPEAEAAFRQAIQLNPDDPIVYSHLGGVLLESNRPSEALAQYRQAEQRGATDATVFDGQAQALNKLGMYTEAVGPATEATRRRPNDPELLKRLGFVLNKVARFEPSVEAYKQAIRLKPDDAEAHWRLGMVHTRQGFLDLAVAVTLEAVRLQPNNPVYHSGLASAYIQNGDIDPALASIREAMRLNPNYAEAHSSLLFMLCYDPKASPEEIFEEHKAWARKFAPPVPPPIHTNDRSPDRKLRIGYVSPDLRNHPVGFFIEPVIQAHDLTKVELVCYDECVWPPDQLAMRLQKKVPTWRISRGTPDEKFAELIRNDRIDILVDLAGHTASNRLGLFARKPAPVQATYLGYPNTSGVPAIDYLLTDEVADPTDAPAYCTEEPYRLPGGFCVFTPRPGAPDVTPSPTAATGRVTFGSLHNQAKLNPGVLDLWAEVLKATPTSRMLFVRHTFTEAARAALRQAFAARGVDAGRIDFHQPPAGTSVYTKSYAEIDIQLDPFPWTGHTTTCESLWMGVPVISLRGRTHAGRMVASVLTFAGLPNWVADTPQEYVALAASWANRVGELAQLRAGLRAQTRRSYLCDVPGFTRHLEDAYRAMWRRWCAGK
jgi:predicted O-linked N-acetylglucosamine transferase (SPINDLY family)